MKSEKAVQSDIIKYVKAKGGYVTNIHRATPNGTPDLLICLGGVFIGCEVKAEVYHNDPSKQMSAWQHKHAKMIKEAKGIFLCPASLEQFIDGLEDNLIYL